MGHGLVRDVDWVAHCLTNLSTPDLSVYTENENQDISLISSEIVNLRFKILI